MSPLDDSLSKFLSLVLRHRPGFVGLQLDAQGWVAVDDLLRALTSHGRPLSRRDLEELVANSDKQRFAMSADGAMIRANQGHSVPVDLALPPSDPPDTLYHGTVARYLASIRERGLIKGRRHHVHLSATRELAITVGKRRGAPCVLEIDARAMQRAGFVFHLSANGVWLTDHVPARFVTAPPADP